jgi:hypothetical protein
MRKSIRRFGLELGAAPGVIALAVLLLATVLAGAAPSAAQCAADVNAKVVAMDQVITYNRMAAFNPAGMIFALARDVFPKGTLPANQTLANSCANPSTICSPGNVQLRADKRPRPITLRVNEEQNLCVELTNLLTPGAGGPIVADAQNEAPGIRLCENPVDGAPRPGICQSEQPATRNVGFQISGMQWVNGAADDGSNVGGNVSSLVAPGSSTTYTVFAEKEGAYVVSSGPGQGGQGGNGAIGSGLFGVVNVEPAGATWYRSQVTREEMVMAADVNSTPFVLEASEQTPDGHPILDYAALYPAGHPYAGEPILAIRDATTGEIVHNELNAVIVGPGANGGFPNDPPPTQVYPDRGEPFREFTIAFHDEIKVVQAFPGWFNALPFTLGSVKDGFAINYGTGGIGSEIIGNRLGVGPMNECIECKYEEFFLTSWVVGDPAMIVDIPANAGLEALLPGQAPPAGTTGPKASKAFYPDDPSNTWHGYLNDRTKIRNIHVGTEHHIFHLHAHQWLFAAKDDGSNYLDAQAIGPGSSFTYEISYGGGGNRNKTAGDSIFHCHFYPHFAQGMWGLWRVHDTFCDAVSGDCGGYDAAGNPLAGGSPTPGVVPIPGKTMAPMPGAFVADTDGDTVPDTPFLGYPFYIAGTIGHRPPTPPLDLVADGGIPRHVIVDGTSLDHNGPIDFNKELLTATGYELPEAGTPMEKAAMAFHGPQPGGVYHSSYATDGTTGDFEVNGMEPIAGAPYAEPCRGDAYDGYPGQGIPTNRHYKVSVVEIDADLNKVGWHYGQQRLLVLNDDVTDTLNGTRAPEPFVIRANTGDCADFDHTNLVPNVYQLDDFQVKTPTDVIGQHIHLVKFDVTSADGAANGWNYEDGTMSPDEMLERHHALTAAGGSWTGNSLGTPGPRTTRQRWYIDPGWKGNIFTHDHYGPSTHQQAGLYGTVLTEPQGSIWTDPVTGEQFGLRADGGPTSWRADIDCADCFGADAHLVGDAWREFYLEFADFQLAYRGQDDGGPLNLAGTPVNPSDRNEVGLPDILLPKCINTPDVDAGPNGCRPEAITAADPGTFVVNMRNEPIPMRVRQGPASASPNDQTLGLAGDLSYAFQSRTDRADARLNGPVGTWPYGLQTATQGAQAGDPFTPLLRVYEDDKVYVRVQVGAHEEGHNFSINGVRWLQSWASPYSGFRNSQMAGISEYFIFRTPGLGAVTVGDFEDYMYQAGSSVDARWNGSWGIMRAYKEPAAADASGTPLIPLPSNPDGKAPPLGPVGQQGGVCSQSPHGACFGNQDCPGGNNRCTIAFNGPCPVGAPERKFDLVAVRAADVLPGGQLEYEGPPGANGLNDPTALLYVKRTDLNNQGMLKANRRVEPLIIRAAAGECVFIKLTNEFGGPPLDLDGFNTMPVIVNQFNGNDVTPSSEVGLHAQLVSYDMSVSDGMNVGFNTVQTAPIGGVVNYKWYAGIVETIEGQPGNRKATPVEYGAINLMASDPIEGSSKGLIGALIIEPAGTTWVDQGEQGRNRCTQATPQFCDGEFGEDDLITRAAMTVTCPASRTENCGSLEPGESFRDFVVLFQDDVNMRFADGSPVPTVAIEEEPEDSGMKAINYRTDAIWRRLGIGPTANAATPSPEIP